MNQTLFPQPRHASFARTHRNLQNASWIVLPQDAGFPLKRRTLDWARELTRRLGWTLRTTLGLPSAGKHLVDMVRKPELPAEGYELTLEEQGPFLLMAADDAGFFYGLQTLAQLLNTPADVPCCTIQDQPSLADRGYMLDVSRCKIPTMDTLRQLIRSLARLRYNSLQLYMEHSFEFAAHKRVSNGFSPLTPEDIIELDDVCHQYFIRLIPNLNSFGHLERWLKYPQYAQLAELPDAQGPKRVLQPNSDSLNFIDALYSEFLPIFTSRTVNIGCDETVELGKGKSAALCQEKGTTRVYLDFLTRLAKTAQAHGFNIQFWGDIIMHNPELIPDLPSGATALEWGYEANHPFEQDTAQFKKSGIPFIICPGTSSWLTILGRTENMMGNIRNAVTHGCQNGAQGILLTDWGDGGHHQYFPISWPGLTMAATMAWNATQNPSEQDLVPGIANAFAPSQDGTRIAYLLLQMGHVNDDFQTQTGNSTPFGRVFTLPDSLIPFYPKFSQEELQKAVAHTQSLLNILDANPFPAEPLVNAELRNSLNMALAALIFMQRATGGTWDELDWKDLMSTVIANHEQLWLARNRSGGLHESSALLREAMDRHPDYWRQQ